MTKTTHSLYPVLHRGILLSDSAGNSFNDILGVNFKPVFARQKKAIVCKITEL